MKTSIATVSISGTLDTKLGAIAKAGFDGIEIFEQDFIAHHGSPRDIGAMVRDHGLEILLFQPFRDFEGLPGDLRRKAFDRAEHKFDLMQELGTDLVLICSSTHPEALGGIDRAADDLAELAERADARGLRIGFEALAWGSHINDHRDAWEVVRRADHPALGLILDSFHTLGRGLDPETIRRIPGDRIFFVQLADAPLIEMDLLYWSRHFRNMPGEGDLDVAGFMRAVNATGYQGPLSLEIFNDQFRGGSANMIAKDGYRSLVHLVDQVTRSEPQGGRAAQRGPVLPPCPATTGIEFVEFASNGAEAEALSDLLRSMGFRHVGSHISKALALWQQGDIRILVNAEESGFAHSAYIAQGTSVCDIGLSVDDAACTLERARLLGSAPFSQPLGPGELDIPAIRGLSGSVLHFIDKSAGLSDVWSVEFDQTGDQSGDQTADKAAGLTRIDHLAQTMTRAEMLSWSLFYTTLFDMHKAPMVDVIDPDGLIHSQAVETSDGAMRITLNGAETHRTLAGNFLSEGFGASVQHIAFASDNIVHTARALADLGFSPLPLSPNYYDDLSARFDLPPKLLAEMRQLNILYDRDGEGEFFQFYSRPYGNGMFFEIVERRGGYAGYGAANAAFRIAAQKRLMRGADIPKR
ncbi:hypothetical protein LCGC14_1428360 [marine sediment metagenome]|uniref:VOC domain-containing protein n=1 Tax=marine sediment metagenome TaxID=412755 RepID=A0A0F9JPN6_9ZZZZ